MSKESQEIVSQGTPTVCPKFGRCKATRDCPLGPDPEGIKLTIPEEAHCARFPKRDRYWPEAIPRLCPACGERLSWPHGGDYLHCDCRHGCGKTYALKYEYKVV